MNLTSINKELQNKKANSPIVIAGPCSAETEEQVVNTAREVKKINEVAVFRAGVWKPRTKPGSFEGVGSEALKWLATAKKETGLKIAVEVANAKHVEEALNHNVDVLWVGARTTVNPFTVQEIADALKGSNAIVLVKNPVNPDLSLWEGAIERIYNAGINKVGAIHRGFSNYAKKNFRNPPHWQIPIELKRKHPKLTFICDPSHICGKTATLLAVSQKALDLEFDGLMIEAHINPTKALSDAEQQITPNELAQLINNIEIRRNVLDVETPNLQEFRRKINLLDEELLDILANRMHIAEEIGMYKKANKIAILQSHRWDEILHQNADLAKQKGLSKEFIIKILSAIHVESIEQQNKIMNEKKDYKKK